MFHIVRGMKRAFLKDTPAGGTRLAWYCRKRPRALRLGHSGLLYQTRRGQKAVLSVQIVNYHTLSHHLHGPLGTLRLDAMALGRNLILRLYSSGWAIYA